MVSFLPELGQNFWCFSLVDPIFFWVFCLQWLPGEAPWCADFATAWYDLVTYQFKLNQITSVQLCFLFVLASHIPLVGTPWIPLSVCVSHRSDTLTQGNAPIQVQFGNCCMGHTGWVPKEQKLERAWFFIIFNYSWYYQNCWFDLSFRKVLATISWRNIDNLFLE